MPVDSLSVASGPGSSLTLSYLGGYATDFVLLQTNSISAPLANWTRVKTNTNSPGSFTITSGSDPREFWRVKSE